MVKVSAFLCFLFIIFPSPSYATDCADLADNVVADAGVGGNCLYNDLPPCSGSRAPANPQHRVNCSDLADLPLCGDIVTGPSRLPRPGKNCVALCSGPAYDNPDPTGHPNWVRGTDYAIFNRDCLRFCDDVETGIVADPGVNCTPRKCHQLPDTTVPDSSGASPNCNILACNLLTVDELNKPKFDTYADRRFCDGTPKCYNFSIEQLPFMRRRQNNSTCAIHDCTPPNTSCGADDVLNITNQGAAYVAEYRRSIYGGLDLSSTSYCNQLTCRPVVQSPYRCVDSSGAITGTSADINRNSNCDPVPNPLPNPAVTPNGYTCENNYCYRTIDCNLAVNNAATECLTATPNTYNGPSDPFDSWFYRPNPSGRAVTNTGVLRTMDNGLCYHAGTMNNTHNWGEHIVINLGPLGSIDMGWFQGAWTDIRSPGACGARRDGNRGTGYIYVCGTNQILNHRASDDAVYFRGHVRTDFSGASPRHTVTVCTRFSNTISLRACGSRTCGINQWFSDITSQACGSEVCKDVTVDEANDTACMMTDSLTTNTPSGCAARLGHAGLTDGFMRVRAVKYYNKICAYFDSNGQLAYNGMFRDGRESIPFNDNDGITPNIVCENDPGGRNGNCHGFDSNSTPGWAHLWRNLLRVHYVDNNRPAGTPAAYRGYLDINGKLYKEQACPKITLRLPPPDQYNIATSFNSARIFSPPVFIRNATKFRGGPASIIPAGYTFGKTDFHLPEMNIQFGTATYKMSLGFNYTGYETASGTTESYPASPGTRTITTTFAGRSYEANLFVRKETSSSDVPQFCLYRRIRDQNNVELDPLRVGCIERNPPDINSQEQRLTDPTLPLRRLSISLASGSTYNNARMSIRYLDAGSNGIDNNCGSDDSCTTAFTLANNDYLTESCAQNIETHRVCVRRDECTALTVECIQNEIAISNALRQSQDASAFLRIRDNCNNTIVPLCNSRRGINVAGGTIFNQTPVGATPDPNAYGWFNELCIVRGFNTRLRTIIARLAANGQRGKCFIDPASPYVVNRTATNNCDDGGKAPNCICVSAPDGYITGPNEEVRLETPHEAGLCVTIPLAQFCQAVDYTPVPNSDPNDTEYVTNSVGRTSYSNVNGVHLTHRDRTNGTSSGHAEYERSLAGLSNVLGECKGFWTYRRSSSGLDIRPTQSCVLNQSGNAEWDTASLRNQCVRFTCPAVTTAGPDANGDYQGGYGALETGENKGRSHGFALWTSYTKTTDFPETRTASGCIPGFKPVGSVPVRDSTGRITSYSGGNFPTRQCDQLGNWMLPATTCERITCPASSPPIPTSASDVSAWQAWNDNGGASFPSINASRSQFNVQAGSIASGTCNQAIGFFQSGVPPTRRCDHLGNWLDVTDSCVSSCAHVTNPQIANSATNGYALWTVVTRSLILYQHCNYRGWNIVIPTGYYPTSQNVAGTNQDIWDASSIRITGDVYADLYDQPNYLGTHVQLTSDVACFEGPPWNFNDRTRSIKVRSTRGTALAGIFGGCVPGYVTNPYPPTTDVDGRSLPAAVANDLTRPASNPTRLCRAIGQTYDIWEAVQNPCINACPGSDRDSRIGVGVTTHPHQSSVNNTINVNWATTPLGQDAYATNWSGLPSLFNASYFSATATTRRTNNHYLLRRHCNADGRWSAPVVLCSANDGTIGNARYNLTTATAGYPNSIAAGSNEVVNGYCASTAYWNSNGGQGPAPQRQCVFDSSAGYIDRVYLSLSGNTQDCEVRSCPSYAGYSSSRVTIPSASRTSSGDARFIAGSGQIIGTCIDGTTSLTSGGTLPHVNCQSDGTWSAVLNENDCKRGCPVPAQSSINLNSVQCGNGFTYSHPAFTIKDGTFFQFIFADVCTTCSYHTKAGYCNDGVLSVNQYSATTTNTCTVPSYVHQTNSFGNNLDLGTLNGSNVINIYSVSEGLSNNSVYYTNMNGNRVALPVTATSP